MGLSAELSADAGKILDQGNYPWARVIAVDSDAILYENKMHRARTVWLHRQKGSGRLRLQMVEGFPCWPPEGFHD